MRKYKGIYEEKTGKIKVDAVHKGRRIRSTFARGEFARAIAFLEARKEQIDNFEYGGKLPDHTFDEACELYLRYHCKKSLLKDHTRELINLCENYGFTGIPVTKVHNRKFDEYRARRPYQQMSNRPREAGITKRKNRTVNVGLEAAKRVLHLCCTEFIDDITDQPWLSVPPRIKLLPVDDTRPAHVLTLKEQRRLFDEMPHHKMLQCDFLLNTGCRKQELPQLEWAKEIRIDALNSSVFRVDDVKSGRIKFVVMNSRGLEIIEELRGTHPTHVFSFEGQPITDVYTSAFAKARERAGVPCTVHDLRHTVASRLSALDVPLQVISDIFDHTYQSMSHFYSMASVERMINALELLIGAKEFVFLRRA